MAIIKKPQTISKITKRNGAKTSSIQSAREPSVIREMGDTDFGELNASKDGLIVSYDAGTNKFVLKSSDELLSTSVEDNNIPDEFVRALEGELNLGQIQVENLDGGVF
jgi:hypothetical protein